MSKFLAAVRASPRGAAVDEHDVNLVAFARVVGWLFIAGPALIAPSILQQGEMLRFLAAGPFALLGVLTLGTLGLERIRHALLLIVYGAWICSVNGLFWTQGLT